MKRILPLILITGLLYAKDYENELHKVRDKIKAVKKESNNLNHKEKSILTQLRDTDLHIANSKKKINKLKLHEREAKELITNLRASKEETNTKLLHQRELIRKRLMLMYKYRTSNFIHSVSYSDAQTSFYMRTILKNDIAQCTKFKHLIEGFSSKEEVEAKELLELTNLRKAEEAEKSKISHQRKKKRSLLKDVRSEKSLKANLLKELETSRANLEKLIASLKRHPTQEFIALVWPVQGKVVGQFGWITDKELGTKLVNKGIDIRAESGTMVVAVADGKVVYEGTFLGYGKIVLLDHQNGFHTLYAHLSEILIPQGEKAKQNEPIGRVGATGIADEPILHFELRKNGIAIDPMKWLQ